MDQRPGFDPDEDVYEENELYPNTPNFIEAAIKAALDRLIDSAPPGSFASGGVIHLGFSSRVVWRYKLRTLCGCTRDQAPTGDYPPPILEVPLLPELPGLNAPSVVKTRIFELQRVVDGIAFYVEKDE